LRFKLENFVDKVIAAEEEHRNSDLFNRIFDLLDVLRNDNSIDSANPNINMALTPQNEKSHRFSQMQRIPSQTSTPLKHQATRVLRRPTEIGRRSPSPGGAP